jgi:hypothetical protein
MFFKGLRDIDSPIEPLFSGKLPNIPLPSWRTDSLEDPDSLAHSSACNRLKYSAYGATVGFSTDAAANPISTKYGRHAGGSAGLASASLQSMAMRHNAARA